MADATVFNVGGSDYNVKDAEARSAVTNLGGQVTSLGGQVTNLGNQVTNLGGQVTNLGNELVKARNVDHADSLLLFKLFDYSEEVTPSATYDNKMYNYNSDAMTDVTNGKVKKVAISSGVLAYYVTTQIVAGSADFPLISYFDSSDNQIGYEYLSTGTVSIDRQILAIPQNASYFYVNSRNYTSYIYAISANNMTIKELTNHFNEAINQNTKVDVTDELLLFKLFDYAEVIDPDTIYNSKFYNYTANTMIDIAAAKVKKVVIDSSVLAYYVTTLEQVGSADFPLISYFDSSNNQIGYEYIGTGTISIDRQILAVPSNAAYFYVNSRDFTSVIYAIPANSMTVKGQGKRIDAIYDYTSLGDVADYTLISSSGMFSTATGSIVSISNASIKKYVIDKEVDDYIVTSYLFAGSTGFPVVVYFNSSDQVVGYEYMNITTGFTKVVNAVLNVPDDAAYFYVNARNFNSVTRVVKSSRDEYAASYTEISDTGMYNVNSNDILTASNGKVKKVVVNNLVVETYKVTSSIFAGSTGFPIITYFNASNEVIGYEYMLDPQNERISIDNARLNIPADASYFYVNSRDMNSVIKAVKSASNGNMMKKHVSILFVGNSMTQDAISYLPYLIMNYYPEIEFKFYVWYVGGKTLAQQYEYFTNDTACEIFSVAENSKSWENYGHSKTMASILQTYKFDIVCMQEYFNYKESYTDSDLADWNNCRDYIQSHYTGGNPLEFISLMHAPRTNALETAWGVDVSGNALILQKTIAQDMIPAGFAKYNGLSSSIGTLGDGHDLTVGDYTHAQEGVPSLLQAYTAMCWLLDKLSINKSVYGCPLRMTTEIYNSINVPGPNLGTGVITGTDEQNLVAQEVAIMAYKEGKSFVNKNIYVEP